MPLFLHLLMHFTTMHLSINKYRSFYTHPILKFSTSRYIHPPTRPFIHACTHTCIRHECMHSSIHHACMRSSICPSIYRTTSPQISRVSSIQYDESPPLSCPYSLCLSRHCGVFRPSPSFGSLSNFFV